MKVDLHTHSYYSDGECSPETLVKMARDCNLAAYALTDHDTVRGVEEALIAGEKLGVNVITGIELSSIKNGDVHIIGLGIDVKSRKLQEELVIIKEKRQIRNRLILEELKKRSMPLNYEDLEKRGENKVIGRTLIAEMMIEKGYVKSVKEAFDFYLGGGKCCYVPLVRLTPTDAVRIIKDAGGLAILAHPTKLLMTDTEKDEFIKELVGVGLDGIETYYYSNTEKEIANYKTLAEKCGLLSSAGSDYHGRIRKSQLGVTAGEIDEKSYNLIIGRK